MFDVADYFGYYEAIGGGAKTCPPYSSCRKHKKSRLHYSEGGFFH
jgi:hypothetical protein